MKNKKYLGQHWLKDRIVLTNIAGCAIMDNIGTVLEIGPGLGVLTSALFKCFKQVIAVEYDPDLARKLPGQFPGKNLKVIHADILDFDLETLPPDYVAVGNIPYYITSPIIMKLLTSSHRPRRIVLLVQKEVAQRIAAAPGRHTILSLAAQAYAEVSLGPVIGRALFTPPPKVDSQVIILDPYPQPIITEDTIAFAKKGFAAPRKKLISNLTATLRLPRSTVQAALDQVGIPPNARPADLSLLSWQALHQALV